VQWVERAVQHVIQALVDARSFEGDHGKGVLDDADRAAIALIGPTDTARLDIGHVAAHRAEVHGVLHVLEGFGQVAYCLGWLTQQMKRQPLSGLGSDPRQRGERLDSPGDRLDMHGGQ